MTASVYLLYFENIAQISAELVKNPQWSQQSTRI